MWKTQCQAKKRGMIGATFARVRVEVCKTVQFSTACGGWRQFCLSGSKHSDPGHVYQGQKRPEQCGDGKRDTTSSARGCMQAPDTWSSTIAFSSNPLALCHHRGAKDDCCEQFANKSQSLTILSADTSLGLNAWLAQQRYSWWSCFHL